MAIGESKGRKQRLLMRTGWGTNALSLRNTITSLLRGCDLHFLSVRGFIQEQEDLDSGMRIKQGIKTNIEDKAVKEEVFMA